MGNNKCERQCVYCNALTNNKYNIHKECANNFVKLPIFERNMLWSKIDKFYTIHDDVLIWAIVLRGQYIDTWESGRNCKNKPTYERDVSSWNEVKTHKKKTMKACMIQNAFKQAISNPEYRMCRNRLMKEFHSITA